MTTRQITTRAERGLLCVVAQVLLRTLAQDRQRPVAERIFPLQDLGVCALFIANEETKAFPGTGLDAVMKAGALCGYGLEQGPVIWVDSANFNVLTGVGAGSGWELRVDGRAGYGVIVVAFAMARV
jgi:hypothetical protein